MSSRIEWSSVDAETFYVRSAGEIEDQYGSTNDGPALAIFTGSDGAVIEASSPQELVAYLMSWAERIRFEHPELWPGPR